MCLALKWHRNEHTFVNCADHANIFQTSLDSWQVLGRWSALTMCCHQVVNPRYWRSSQKSVNFTLLPWYDTGHCVGFPLFTSSSLDWKYFFCCCCCSSIICLNSCMYFQIFRTYPNISKCRKQLYGCAHVHTHLCLRMCCEHVFIYIQFNLLAIISENESAAETGARVSAAPPGWLTQTRPSKSFKNPTNFNNGSGPDVWLFCAPCFSGEFSVIALTWRTSLCVCGNKKMPGAERVLSRVRV